MIAFFHIFLAFLVIGCSQTSTMKGDEKKTTTYSEKAPSQPPPTHSADEERATAPAPIAGSYLRCAEEAPATDDSPDALYGCQVSDDNGLKRNIDPGSFGYRQNGASSVSVFIKESPADSRFHALYLIRSRDRSTLQNALNEISIVVTGEALESGRIAQLLPDITVPNSIFPEPSAEDYEAVRNQMIFEADSSAPSPPIP